MRKSSVVPLAFAGWFLGLVGPDLKIGLRSGDRRSGDQRSAIGADLKVGIRHGDFGTECGDFIWNLQCFDKVHGNTFHDVVLYFLFRFLIYQVIPVLREKLGRTTFDRKTHMFRSGCFQDGSGGI